MPSSWAPRGAEGPAVAARTYAITTTSAGGGSFDVYPDTRSQMYGGVAAETSSTKRRGLTQPAGRSSPTTATQ